MNTVEFYGENTFRDVVEVKKLMSHTYNQYGPSRFDPILPGLYGRSEQLKLVLAPILDERIITWTIHADNATPRSGSIALNQILFLDKPEE